MKEKERERERGREREKVKERERENVKERERLHLVDRGGWKIMCVRFVRACASVCVSVRVCVCV